MNETCVISKEKGQIGEIDTLTLKILLGSKVPLILLDARSAQWDDKRRIPGAKSLMNESSEQAIIQLIPQKDALVIVYCTHENCGASTRLAAHLSQFGYIHILKYSEGINAWESQGLPIDRLS